MGRLGFHLKLD